jgi:hypothetical protein
MQMANPAKLDDKENWDGGFYELGLELGPRDDARMDAALETLWRLAAVDGCSAVIGNAGFRHREVPLTVSSLEDHHLHGVVRLPSGKRIVCGAIALRDLDGRDWLDFFLPLGALGRVDARVGGFPFGSDGGGASLEWRRPIDEWFVSLASQLMQRLPFALALIGFESCGDLTVAELAERGVSAERPFGIFLPGAALEYLPATY